MMNRAGSTNRALAAVPPQMLRSRQPMYEASCRASGAGSGTQELVFSEACSPLHQSLAHDGDLAGWTAEAYKAQLGPEFQRPLNVAIVVGAECD
jgi:hypothetical protein